MTDYLEGRLPLHRRLIVRFHVLLCPNCRTYLRQMQLVVQTLGKLPPEAVTPEICAGMAHRFTAWHKQQSQG